AFLSVAGMWKRKRASKSENDGNRNQEARSVMLLAHRDVDDREHHENVGLQQHDQDVEDRPAQVENAAEEGAVDTARRPHPQQQEDDFARVDVAEEAQAVRQRLRYPLDHLEQEIERPQQEVIAERSDE